MMPPRPNTGRMRELAETAFVGPNVTARSEALHEAADYIDRVDAKLAKVGELAERLRPWATQTHGLYRVEDAQAIVRELLALFAPPPPTFSDDVARAVYRLWPNATNANAFAVRQTQSFLAALVEATDEATVRALLTRLTEF